MKRKGFVRGLRRAYNRNSESSGGSRGGDRGTPPPLLLGQTEARRAEKKILDAAPPLSKGLDDPHPPRFC